MAINFLDFSVSPPQEGVLAAADVAAIPDGSIVLYPDGTGEQQEMTVAQLQSVYNGIWTPTFSDFLVNDDATIGVGTITLYAAMFSGGPDAVAFQIHFSHTPTTGVREAAYHFDFSFPTNIGDIQDFYGTMNYGGINTSATVTEVGNQSGGALFVSSQNQAPAFTRSQILSYFQNNKQTAFPKYGVVSGTFIL